MRYNPADADLQAHKVHLSPFDTGSPEERLKFQTKLNLIMTGNGLTTGTGKHNLARALLKGEALRNFNNKAAELGNETNAHVSCRVCDRASRL